MIVRGDYIVFDEGYYLLLARSLRAGHGFALNGLPHVALSPLQPLIVAGLSMLGIPDLSADGPREIDETIAPNEGQKPLSGLDTRNTARVDRSIHERV